VLPAHICTPAEKATAGARLSQSLASDVGDMGRASEQLILTTQKMPLVMAEEETYFRSHGLVDRTPPDFVF